MILLEGQCRIILFLNRAAWDFDSDVASENEHVVSLEIANYPGNPQGYLSPHGARQPVGNLLRQQTLNVFPIHVNDGIAEYKAGKGCLRLHFKTWRLNRSEGHLIHARQACTDLSCLPVMISSLFFAGHSISPTVPLFLPSPGEVPTDNSANSIKYLKKRLKIK
jgi:hypothetical protein